MKFILSAENTQLVNTVLNLPLEDDMDTTGKASETDSVSSGPGPKRRKSSSASVSEIAIEGMTRALKNMKETDEFQIFGNFVASQLRNISNPSDARKIQRKMTRTMMDAIDNLEDLTANN